MASAASRAAARQEILAGLHRELDQGTAQGTNLGCQYVDAGRLADLERARTRRMSIALRGVSGHDRADIIRACAALEAAGAGLSRGDHDAPRRSNAAARG